MKPIKRFGMDVSYDSAQHFFQDLGFNKLTIDRLKPYFSSLEQFVDYDIFVVIERLEADILVKCIIVTRSVSLIYVFRNISIDLIKKFP